MYMLCVSVCGACGPAFEQCLLITGEAEHRQAIILVPGEAEPPHRLPVDPRAFGHLLPAWQHAARLGKIDQPARVEQVQIVQKTLDRRPTELR